jgi:hypothetical protein
MENSLNKSEIKIIYLSCHHLLKKKFGINKEVNKKEVYSEFGRHFLVPKNLRIVVIKELESLDLVKVVNRENIIIKKGEIDIEKDISKLYQEVGLF